MMRLVNLELHVAHGCNLTCESCSHYSNQGHKGLLDLEEAGRWMAPWGPRLDVQVFSLLGGEPTINPRLSEFIPLARAHWPRAHIRIVTNGFFLHRHPALPEALRADGDASLCLSIHHTGAEYQEKLAPVLDLLARWHRESGVECSIYPSAEGWTRRYKGFGAQMEPFDDRQPRRSWENCRAKLCPQLFEGALWKCAALAYLRMQDARHGLSASWKPHLGYAPLAPGCSDAELSGFLAREEETQCGMCPAEPQRFALPLPFPKVTRTGGE